ncbi:MAG: Gfo/Idh/MocA family protein [Terriglobia bacterium]
MTCKFDPREFRDRTLQAVLQRRGWDDGGVSQVAISYVEAEAVQQAASRSAGKLFVRHNRRFFGDFVQVKEIIDSGILGEVFLIRVRGLKYDLRNDWQTLKKCGGGLMLNMGPHFIEHCLMFLGWKYESVWANLKLVAATGDAEDHAKVIFKGDKGLVVDLEISGGSALDEVSFAAYGKHGALACDGKMIRLKYYDPRKVVSNPAHAETPGMDAPFGSGIGIPWVEEMIPVQPPAREIWNEVYKAIREGGEYPITVEQAVRVIKTICDVKSMAGF